MGNNPSHSPASLRVFRYRVGEDRIHTIIGPMALRLPHAQLAAHAAQALATGTLMFHTVAQDRDPYADELCFVPKGDHCDILSVHTHGRQRRDGDLRRGLTEILNDLAAAVACGSLRILDPSELEAEITAGDELVRIGIESTASLALIRDAADLTLRDRGVGDLLRQRTVLGISEAATNTLLHAGGRGHVTIRRLDDRLRFVVADQGSGLTFLNWNDRPATGNLISMGYGFKIILDYLDAVGLHSGTAGTTLILDRKTD